MANIRPFRAVRPSSAVVSQVASVPYDVVDRAECVALAEGNPLSFLRVSRAELELPEATNPYSDEVYARAHQNYESLVQGGHLQTEEEPSLYVYRLKMGDHVQVGLAAAYSVDEYNRDLIMKHEKTRQEKEDDRTRHIVTLKAQTGPVFLTYRGTPEVDRLVQEAQQGQPLYDLVAADGVAHTIWKVTNPEAFVQAMAAVPRLYIADGHHRAASASRAHAQAGTEASAWFLAVAFPAEQLRILPYNRLVADLQGKSPADFLASVKAKFPVTENASPSPARRGQASMYLDGKWYGLELPAAQGGSPSASLDSALLQEHLLAPLLGIGDPRTDKRIDFVGGIRGTAELVRKVGEGKAAVAFSMYPTSLDELMAISDAGEIMPPKSTWFEPKLRDALLINTI